MNAESPVTGLGGFLKSLNCDRGYGVALLCVCALLAVPELIGDPARRLLRFDRGAIGAGQWWRLLSAHFVHIDLEHAVLNTLGLVLMWALFARDYSPWRWARYLLRFRLRGRRLRLWFANPELQWYVGASGALHGVMTSRHHRAPAASRPGRVDSRDFHRGQNCLRAVGGRAAIRRHDEHHCRRSFVRGSWRNRARAGAEFAPPAALTRRYTSRPCRTKSLSFFPARDPSRWACSQSLRSFLPWCVPRLTQPPAYWVTTCGACAAKAPSRNSTRPNARSQPCWSPVSPPGVCGRNIMARRPR